jgi:hypothetical protein
MFREASAPVDRELDSLTVAWNADPDLRAIRNQFPDWAAVDSKNEPGSGSD